MQPRFPQQICSWVGTNSKDNSNTNVTWPRRCAEPFLGDLKICLEQAVPELGCTSHLVLRVTEEGNFSFSFLLVHLNNHGRLVATVLGSLG